MQAFLEPELLPLLLRSPAGQHAAADHARQAMSRQRCTSTASVSQPGQAAHPARGAAQALVLDSGAASQGSP